MAEAVEEETSTLIQLSTPVVSLNEEEKYILKDEDFFTKGNRIEVGVNFYVNRIDSVDLVNESFYADADIELQWKATKEEYLRFKRDVKHYEPDYHPAFQFQNGECSAEIQYMNGNTGFRVVGEGDLDSWSSLIGKEIRYPIFNLAHYKFHGTFRESFELESFPLDCQDLQISIELDKKVDLVVFVPSYKQFLGDYCGNLNLKFSALDEYVVHQPRLEFVCNEYADNMSAMNYRAKLERRSLIYIPKIVLFIAVTAGAALLTFTLDPIDDLPDRYGFVVTLLLTAVAFQFVVTSTLPNLPYLTFLDWYIFVSFMFLGLVMLMAAVTALIGKKDSIDIDLVNMICAVSAGAVFVIYNLYFAIQSFVLKKAEQGKLSYNKLDFDRLDKAKDPPPEMAKSVKFTELFFDDKIRDLLKEVDKYEDVPRPNSLPKST
eukprot:71345_1